MRTNRHMVRAAGAGLLLTATAFFPAAGAVTFDHGSVWNHAFSSVTWMEDGAPQTIRDDQQQFDEVTGLAPWVFFGGGTRSGAGFDQLYAQSGSDNRIYWSDATQGFIGLYHDGYARFVSDDGTGVSAISGVAAGGGDPADVRYDFSLTGPAHFTLDYGLFGDFSNPSVMPLAHVSIVRRAGSDPVWRDVCARDLAGFGAFTCDLNGAGQYAFAASAVFPTLLFRQEARGSFQTSAALQFHISEGPEPGAWMMLIAGFGMVGATLRAGRRIIPTQ